MKTLVLTVTLTGESIDTDLKSPLIGWVKHVIEEAAEILANEAHNESDVATRFDKVDVAFKFSEEYIE
jgi:hypothetical protein